MSDECGMCKRIKEWEAGNLESLVAARTRTGYVVLFATQLFPGHTLFITRKHASELHDLPADERTLHVDEMARVAEAVWLAFGPRKLNYEYLGNNGPHIHWNLVPRPHVGDPSPKESMFQIPEFWERIRNGTRETPEVEAERVEKLRAALLLTGVTIEPLVAIA
jgi:diadenosine tetraphosphate (Ap4A) HIT family hydrolase